MSSGKGDLRRPKQVSDNEFASNWDRVFKQEEPKIEMTLDEVQEYIENLKIKLEQQALDDIDTGDVLIDELLDD